jgi:hypothetical protein
MSKSRASIFGDEETTSLDLKSFAPKASPDAKAPAAEQVRAVAQAANFPSRESAATKPSSKKQRPNRQYRTGRNVQLSIKALAETVDIFYAVTDEQKWVLGYTLQRAMDALQRELKNAK